MLIKMNEEDMMKKGYLASEENAKIIEAIIKKHQKRTERII